MASASEAIESEAKGAPPALDPERLAGAVMRLLFSDPRFKVVEAEIRGNRYRVFENAPPHLRALFELGAAHGDKDFLLYEDERRSFAATWRDACRFANALTAQFGVRPGDRVAIAMRNYPEFCIAYMGTIAAGAVVAPLNAWWKTPEFDYALKDCGARIVVCDGKRAELLAPLQATLGLTRIVARDPAPEGTLGFQDVLDASPSDAVPDTPIGADDDYAIYYTSGSTGHPKGAILTHRGAVSVLMSWGFLATAVKEARDGVGLYGDDPGILLAVPLFHVTGSHAIFMLSWMVGRRMAMLYRWDAEEAARVVRRHALTNFVGVPSQSFELMQAAGPEGLPSLIDIGAGGAKRPPEHVRQLKSALKTANPSSGYGLTETNAAGCVISLDDYQKRPDSTGRALPPLTDIKTVGEAGDCAPDEVGEIWIRSPGNFRGYLNLPEETARALTPDGWFRTGDLGKIDAEGFVYIVDRLKDMILRGGENIGCLEVEAAAYEHPAVAEAVVFSVPDEQLGERVGLVAVLRPGAEATARELRAFIGERLADFKTPERIWISPRALPRLGSAKFDKITIRKTALQHPPDLAV